jgi:ribosomal protein L12E/L44/L45/RPP1/RPP2
LNQGIFCLYLRFNIPEVSALGSVEEVVEEKPVETKKETKVQEAPKEEEPKEEEEEVGMGGLFD